MRGPYALGGCPVCATQASDVIVDREGSTAELEALWRRLDRSGEPVPLAQLRDTVSFTQAPPLAVVRCRSCGLLYRNPRERDVAGLYREEAVDEARLAALHAEQLPTFTSLVRRLTQLHGGPGTGLEVASYTGAFLDAASAARWRFRGCDVNPRVVAFLRDRGHDVSSGGIEDVAADSALDVVACWNAFEQLPDPLAAARAAHERLRPGGLLALRVPSGRFYRVLRPHLDGPLAGAARMLLAQHNFLAFPYRHGFTPRSLDRLLSVTGFRRVRLAAASVLPAGADRAARALAALERAFRPLTGPPWLELYARRR